ncbi:MAG: hypothetical protein ACR2H3_13580 [Acidimicrobiales bacterium]
MNDALELELRALPGVAYVGFLPCDGSLIVQVMVLGAPDAAETRLRAEQLCRAHLDEPFTVEIAGGSRPARVQVLSVGVTDDNGPAVEMQFSLEGEKRTGRRRPNVPSGAAEATFEALRALGANIPFEVEATALFEHTVGEGVVVILTSPQTGGRYGVAAGQSVEVAAVRATLHALNRYLAAQTLPV